MPTVSEPQSTSHITNAIPGGIVTPRLEISVSHFKVASVSSIMLLTRVTNPEEPGSPRLERID